MVGNVRRTTTNQPRPAELSILRFVLCCYDFGLQFLLEGDLLERDVPGSDDFDPPSEWLETGGWVGADRATARRWDLVLLLLVVVA